MASAVIHIAVAKEIGKRINRNSKDYYLGSIAPDIAKQIGWDKTKTHFLTNSVKDQVPVLDDFLDLYKDDMDSDFTLGYFIHLYTDKLWFNGFLDELVLGDAIKALDGTILHFPEEEVLRLIYNDYTNINVSIIDKYELDLSLFSEEFELPKTKIDIIPIDKLNILIDKMGIIIENSKKETSYIFNAGMVIGFIKKCTNEIYDYLVSNGYIK